MSHCTEKKNLRYELKKPQIWATLEYRTLCCWFYASLEQLVLDQVFEEPNHPFDKWTMLHNRGWLEARGLDKKGLAQDLCERGAMYIMQEGGPPPVLTPRGGPVTNVQLMICSFSTMVCQLMSSSVTESHIKDVEQHIHIFWTPLKFLIRNWELPKRNQHGLPPIISFAFLTYQTCWESLVHCKMYGKGGDKVKKC